LANKKIPKVATFFDSMLFVKPVLFLGSCKQ